VVAAPVDGDDAGTDEQPTSTIASIPKTA
jgi:hypothetical protein